MIRQASDPASTPQGVNPLTCGRLPALTRSVGRPPRSPLDVHRVIEAIEHDHARPLTGAELAERFGCSREHLARAFRKTTGTTIREYLAAVRSARALRLVAAGTKVEAAALLVGWSRATYYRRGARRRGC